MNKLTREFLEEQITKVEYQHLPDSTTVLCIIWLKSGFVVTGESACIEPAVFCWGTGGQIAYEKAFDKLWELFGFYVKQKAFEEQQ
ncbi:Gp49 family protein [Volucribacter amazonae]|uniref:Uncharacterized protein n=1 Tax=Volucribacter amazonae TaxID=256731 RepID=A0A9X4SHE6_9PAST|nr:Gp49 family protein [Volucribacter amazonae]MDG6894567.1 hypothetical protein [Volucribacter amazonae]